jgi:hypothetical protein
MGQFRSAHRVAQDGPGLWENELKALLSGKPMGLKPGMFRPLF